MKLETAMAYINYPDPRGYRVHFEWREGRLLRSDYFPERDEPLIKGKDEAWDLAFRFERYAPENIVNIYVIDERWMPVGGPPTGAQTLPVLRRYPDV